MKRIRLAITGGIGSGKSTALELLREMGYPTFSCDAIYKEMLESQEYLKLLNEIFPEVFTDGIFDKARLSATVFQNKESRERLNSIAHPLIMKRLFEKMDKVSAGVTIAEVPLLFEIDAEKEFDYVFVIMREKDARLDAIKNRDCLSTKEIQKRMDAQIDLYSNEGAEKLKQKNVFIINNNLSKTELRENLRNALAKINQL